MEVTIDTTITFQNLLDARKRVTHHIGGTRSGKSYGIIQYLVVQALQQRQDISIVRRTVPTLKRSVIKDLKEILVNLNLWSSDEYNIYDRDWETKY